MLILIWFIIQFIRIASIKQALGLYDDAIKDYLTVLSKLDNHIPTLKGLGEAYYLLAKESIEKSVNCNYIKYVETSINVIIFIFL